MLSIYEYTGQGVEPTVGESRSVDVHEQEKARVRQRDTEV